MIGKGRLQIICRYESSIKKKKKEEEEGREKETQRLLFLETTRLVFHQEYYHRYDEAIQVSSEIVDRRYIHRIPVSGKYYEEILIILFA